MDTPALSVAPVIKHKRSVSSHRPAFAERIRKDYETRGVPESKREPEPWLTEYQKVLNLAPSRPINKLDPGQTKMLKQKLGPLKFASYIKRMSKDEDRKDIVKEAEAYLNAADAQCALWRYQWKLIKLSNRLGCRLIVPSHRIDAPKAGFTGEIRPFNHTIYDSLNMDLPMCLPWNEDAPEKTPEWNIWTYLKTSPKTHSSFTFQVVEDIIPTKKELKLTEDYLLPAVEDIQTLGHAGMFFNTASY